VARIRSIKPEFWTDEKLSLLDPVTRLVFLGLISMADDAGRLVDNVKLLDGMLFPSTDDTCRDSLDVLARTSRVIRYRSSSGQPLIQIANWERHQKVDHPNKYVLPGPEDAALIVPDTSTHSRDTRETLATTSRDVRDTTPDLRSMTNDQRSVINDPRGARDESWMDSVSDQWRKARGGTAPVAMIERELTPLREQYGEVVLRSAVTRFLASEQARFGPSFLATNFGDYVTDKPPPNGQQTKADRLRAQAQRLKGAPA
jgi:hypothetical protein